jgi:S1/P1 Nuclease
MKTTRGGECLCDKGGAVVHIVPCCDARVAGFSVRKQGKLPKKKQAMRRFFLAVVVLVLATAAPALAWNDEGHMAVAYLAYQRLRPATRDRANALLKLNPYYPRWVAAIPAGTPPADADRMIFMIAATWPDQIRGDPTYKDDGPNLGNTPAGPDTARNIGYADHLRHKYWHFIDIPYSQDGTPLPRVPAPNAETQIATFRAALGADKSDDVKSYDLAWLEHLVGDVHQPLHAINRISAAMPEGDFGGGLALLCAAPCGSTLHLFWDRLVGSQSSIALPTAQADLATELRSAMNVAKKLPEADARLAGSASEAAWVRESFADAKRYVYVGPIGPGPGPYTITPAYFEAAKRVAEQRATLAGARLANLLNDNLK